MPQKVSFTLDGKIVEASEGTPILEAAKSVGIEVPHYCYHPALGNPGVCRLCMVEVEGMSKLQVSCRLGAKAGLVVRSNSAAARAAQASSLEFHLANHPLDCPVCDQAGECWLQDYYMRFGLYASHVREDKTHKPKRVDIGRHVMLDSERCILCTRCTRFLDQVTKTGELGIFHRGSHSELKPYPGKRVDNAYSGNIIDICPVGALTDKDFRFQVRVWYLDRTPSVCTGCARGCSIEVHSNTKRPWHAQGRRVARLTPRHNPEVNGWWICDEGRYSYPAIDSPTRLKAVSLFEEGKLLRLDWPETTRRLSQELGALLGSQGPEGLAVILSGTLSNEDLFLAKALFSQALKPGYLLLRPGPDQLGEEDDLLRRKEKVPNLRGAELMGFGATILESSWDAIDDALKSGRLWGLYVVDRDPISVWGKECRKLLQAIPLTVYQGTNATLFSEIARWVLPACSYVEEESSFTNFQGHVQKTAAAVPALVDSRPDWMIFRDLWAALAEQKFAALEGISSAQSGPQVFSALCKMEPAFADLSWDSLGNWGRKASQHKHE